MPTLRSLNLEVLWSFEEKNREIVTLLSMMFPSLSL